MAEGITRTRVVKSSAKKASPASLTVSAEPNRMPLRIRLVRPYGFIEETHNKGVFNWKEGEIVTNPVTINMLISRGASWEAC